MAEMEEFIKQYENVTFNGLVSFDVFKNINVIVEWIEIMKQRQVSDKHAKSRIRALYNICNYMQIHPQKLNVDLASKIVNEMKQKKRNGEEVPKGLSYTVTREAIRSFFTTVLGISGEVLSAKGVDASETERSGEFSKERVTQEVRMRLDNSIKQVVTEAESTGLKYLTDKGKEKIIKLNESDYPYLADEILGFCKFCYNTGTRKMACLNFELSNPKNIYNEKMWTINTLDKGRKGGHKWEKILTEFALSDFKEYIKKRFNITDDIIEMKAREIGIAFPSILKRELRDKDFSVILGIALKRAGKETEIPTHIWRHTFAQDFLDASGHNYELCASIGGWDSTAILKKHYGQMSNEAKIKGLRKAMGVKAEEEKPQPLKW